MTSPSRPSHFDPRTLTPADLSGLPDNEFRKVVDADLRRRVRPDDLPEAVSVALRDPKHVRRWHATLTGILASVNGQLSANELDHESQVGTLTTQIHRLGPDEVHRRSALLLAIDDLNAEHLKAKAARERFRTGVEEHLVLAQSMLPDTHLREDRDHYARRVRALEQAIEAHRVAVLQDLDGDEPDELDTALWAALAAADD